MMTNPEFKSPSALSWRVGTSLGWTITIALAVLGLYLLAYHWSHLLLAIPYLLLITCPLMHLMHRGHRHNHGKRE